MNSQEIRNRFLQFFQERQHKLVPSSPILASGDPSLMFVNAGMNQFKGMFLAKDSPEFPRVTNTQRCLRVSGKHNDLEEVGIDSFHHTMFEMLGNWSFGDYFKKLAIPWAWELLTEQYRIDPKRLSATIFEGNDRVPRDEESAEIWSQLLPQSRIFEAGVADNFWEMGATGPCGPCSEIYYDTGYESGQGAKDFTHPDMIELWNLVFIQYSRRADGVLEELPRVHVDTGMGLERLVRVLQGKVSNYDTDLFEPLRESLMGILPRKFALHGMDKKQQGALQVIMDHVRAVSFCIADGQIPGNSKAGYVVRRILRRAVRFGFSQFSLGDPFLHKLVAPLSEQFREIFPTLESQKSFVSDVIREEESLFLRTLEKGIRRFEGIVSGRKERTLDGEESFELYDTYGFPLDLVEQMASEIGFKVHIEGFNQRLEMQKERSRGHREIGVGDWSQLGEDRVESLFVGYHRLKESCRVVACRTLTGSRERHQLIMSTTPFYPEGGGQVGDTGVLKNEYYTLRVLGCQREAGIIFHEVDTLPKDWPSLEVEAIVDAGHRKKIEANHSCTHLLQASLRRILGPHVQQRGSLVHEKALRFDFSHFSKLEDEQVQQVESLVNRVISDNVETEIIEQVPIEKARRLGALSLFGEKYGDKVRVVTLDPSFSVELCGGCHVSNTSEIRFFKIVSQGSVAAGIRRVEAVTADAAMQHLQIRGGLLSEVSKVLGNPEDVLAAAQNLSDTVRDAATKVEKQWKIIIGYYLQSAKERMEEMNGIGVLVDLVPFDDAEILKRISHRVRSEHSPSVVLLGSVIGQKAFACAACSDSVPKISGLDMRDLMKVVAPIIGGGGGGQPFLATCGGKHPQHLPKALEKARAWIADHIHPDGERKSGGRGGTQRASNPSS